MYLDIEKSYNGFITISTIYKGCYVKRKYLYYTKKDAIKLFKAYLKSL